MPSVYHQPKKRKQSPRKNDLTVTDMADEDKSNGNKTPLPQAETLALDIVYLLDNEGYGYSTQISTHMIDLKPRRYTSREVVGILRNRPMFRHAQSRNERGNPLATISSP